MRIRSPRTRALIGFAALGLYWGAWGAALPEVQRRSHAGDADLGLALVALALGALISMRAAGVLIDRFGPRLTPATVGLLAATGVLPAFADSPIELSAVLFLLGAASGAMDVAINADAVREEVASGRPLLNLAHAAFSIAVVVSSLGTGLLRWAGAEPIAVFGLAAVLVVTAAIAVRPGQTERWTPPARDERPKFLQRVPGWLLLLGALGALAFWIENAWQSWGAVHLERTLGASPATSALGPGLFAAAMAAGRLSAHRVVAPGKERTVLVAGAALAGIGSAVAAVAPSIALSLVGIVVAGAGCAVCAPTVVSLAGRAAAPHERATVVGSITTLMYLGFLIGPAAVGGVAELTTLRISLGTVAGVGFLLSLLFAVVRLPAATSG